METRISKLAISSLVLGIAGFILPILGFIGLLLGVAALIKIKRSAGSLKGRGLAISGIILALIVLVLLAVSVSNVRKHYRAFRLPSDSMLPAIKKNATIIVDRKAYINVPIQRGDIITFVSNAQAKSKLLCKRVAGLPGEKLQIKNGQIYINGIVTLTPGLDTSIHYYNRGDFGKEGRILKIPDDAYYVLGDNSAASQDSRYLGFINKKDIYGKVVLTYDKTPPYKKIIELMQK